MKIAKSTEEINHDGIIIEEMDLNHVTGPKPRSISLYMPLILILAITGSYGLLKLGTINSSKPDISIENLVSVANASNSLNLGEKEGSASSRGLGPIKILASKNGTRYYFSSCKGSNRIKEENKIYFNNEDDAKAAGYSLAANCKPSL